MFLADFYSKRIALLEAAGYGWIPRHFIRSDLDEGTLQICQSLVVTADGVSLEPPKTARGERTVALDALTVGVLRKHRAQQEELVLVQISIVGSFRERLPSATLTAK